MFNSIGLPDVQSGVMMALSGHERGCEVRDDVSVTNDASFRKEMVECCLESDAYDGNMPEFTEENGPLGKSMNNPQTREKLGWVPVHASFVEFVEAGATDSFYPKRRKSTWK